MDRNQVFSFLLSLGASIHGTNGYRVVEDIHYTGIPSDKKDMYCLIELLNGQVVRILAAVEYTNLVGKDDQVLLSAQFCTNEKEKYGEHMAVHGFFSLDDKAKIIDELEKEISTLL